MKHSMALKCVNDRSLSNTRPQLLSHPGPAQTWIPSPSPNLHETEKHADAKPCTAEPDPSDVQTAINSSLLCSDLPASTAQIILNIAKRQPEAHAGMVIISCYLDNAPLNTSAGSNDSSSREPCNLSASVVLGV